MLSEWNINFDTPQDISCLSHMENERFLLDTETKTFSFLERIIYEIAMFHFEKLNIIFDKNKHYIEFHFLDNYKPKTPLLTTITYLNDSSIVNMITNLDIEKYKFKNLNDLEFCISFPKKYKHISFPGKFHYSQINLQSLYENSVINSEDEKHKCLYIHLYDKRPRDVYFYYEKSENVFDSPMLKLNEVKNNKIMDIKKDVFNFDFFDDLIYRNDKVCILTVLSTIDLNDTTNHDIFYFKRDNFNILEKINDEYRINIKEAKYDQVFVLEKYLQMEICAWIIHEVEHFASNNDGWKENKIDLERVASVFSFIIYSSNLILQKIKSLYCIDENSVIKINDISIVKNTEKFINSNHTDGDIFVKIGLNTFTDFTLQYKNGPHVNIDLGDMVIYSKQNEYIELNKKTLKQEKYFLIMSINVYEN